MLQYDYLVAKIGVDTAENEMLEIRALSLLRSLSGQGHLARRAAEIFSKKLSSERCKSVQIL